jgi:ATP-dependent Lon protease
VGFWDVVAFDEFAGRKKKAEKALVDIMKNYMANKTFSRGIETLGAEASMVFVGNTRHNVAYMLKYSDLFSELPEQYYDSAFMDRLHCYLPGWEVPKMRGEMFSAGYGYVVEYLAEILRAFRNQDFSQLYRKYYELVSDISTRDRDGIQKTFSGLMKIIFPNQIATEEEIKELLEYSMENRKRIKDQLMRLDKTYEPVRFAYADKKTECTLLKRQRKYNILLFIILVQTKSGNGNNRNRNFCN